MIGNRKNTQNKWLEFGRATGWLRLPSILLALATAAFSPVCGRADDSWGSFLSRYGAGKNDRQFYLAGVVGADFATLDKVTGTETTVPNQSIFTAGGAAGIRFLRENGGLRLEFEGRGRDQVLSTVAEPGIGSFTNQATDGWSAMVNVWRDYKPFDSFGVYGGGGIGSGGYRSVISGTGLAPLLATANDRVTNFAWQAGGGIFYEISQRAALDLGYRFFSISESTATGESIIGGGPFTYPTNFAASELLLTLRIYEPFRGWRTR